MAKEAVFTMKLEPELRDAFMAAAQRVDRPASQIMREMMREFVEKRQEEQDYLDFYRRKVEQAQKSIDAGRFFTTEQVEAHLDKLLADLETKGNRKRA